MLSTPQQHPTVRAYQKDTSMHSKGVTDVQQYRPTVPDDLAEVVDAWEKLPNAVKAGFRQWSMRDARNEPSGLRGGSRSAAWIGLSGQRSPCDQVHLGRGEPYRDAKVFQSLTQLVHSGRGLHAKVFDLRPNAPIIVAGAGAGGSIGDWQPMRSDAQPDSPAAASAGWFERWR
jgi:hypothetical protein